MKKWPNLRWEIVQFQIPFDACLLDFFAVKIRPICGERMLHLSSCCLDVFFVCVPSTNWVIKCNLPGEMWQVPLSDLFNKMNKHCMTLWLNLTHEDMKTVMLGEAEESRQTQPPCFKNNLTSGYPRYCHSGTQEPRCLRRFYCIS